ncbi:hypothetical protein [Janthinobacterium sp. B9-8]|uniref:hypothetical protein n=1 Tax=Janthinobacterium sp. B9-8 TaxID=1236179 RepID=UPI00061CF6FD|nr:hypothetical protein [Janthinobacterium sp. B9-8]AMC35130.1 hypothetical protein VN23_11165 [Janthinobacterium sp. B9-8]
MSDEKKINLGETPRAQQNFNSSVDPTRMASTPSPEPTAFKEFIQQAETQYPKMDAEIADSATSEDDRAANVLTMFGDDLNFFAKLNSSVWGSSMQYWLNASEQGSVRYFRSLNVCLQALCIYRPADRNTHTV